MSDTYAIQFNGAGKSFDSFRLGPIDLRVEPGVVVAVVGPNGSGKTTLFQMLLNIVQPDEGVIRIFGEAYGQREVEIKRRIGYVPDSSYAEEAGWRIDELVRFYSHWYPAWSPETWRSLSERFELDPKAKVSLLSKGMKRRLAFSMAVAQSPDLLVLDEPSSGLDPFAWRIMLDEIRQFMADGERTVLIATHTIEEVRRLADYVAFLYDGKLLDYRVKDTLIDDWKTLWIEAAFEEAAELPGVVDVELGPLTRLTSDRASETERALEEAGIAVAKRQQVELDEMLHHMIVAEKRKQAASGRTEGELHR
ncbi:ATP-binding cassette domain-containing protein [Paenibacillus flagellatus]|uniref:ABC transporter ATP-binding protein n=1 Tax=Paenibacillus flagellatus TaxID=2211139 RepID=A0A2V5JTV6_9BACL|nr:ABC transporter ATP-binding protein [Paenibacillus flagellatus]PYI49929.1 ABC transporter ATP-binding protein [Paenibacillus flagellatus]